MAQAGDGSSAPKVRVRIFLEMPLKTPPAPLAARVLHSMSSDHAGSVLQLMNRGAEATTQVQVVIDATDTTSELMMTISTDEAGSKVVTIPSDPIIIAVDGNTVRHTVRFTLTTNKAGIAEVTIVVTDGINNVTVPLRVVVGGAIPQHTLSVIEPQMDTVLQLMSRGAEATTQVQVVIDATDAAAELTMTISTDGAGVVAIPSDPIIIAATGDMMRRTQFELIANKAGVATVTIAVTDGVNNATTTLRIEVVEPPPLVVRVVTDGSVLQLVSGGDEATAQIQVVIDATDTAAELEMTISTDEAGVVTIPSNPIIVAADGRMRRTVLFELTAKKAGMAAVTITVTDGVNNATTTLRIEVVELPSLVVRVVTDGPVLQLVSGGDEATAQIQVVIDATDTTAELEMTISIDDAEVATVPGNPIIVTAVGNMIRRTAQFALTAKKAGAAAVTIVVTDGENDATTTLRIEVAEGGEPMPQHTLAVIEPQTDTELRLLSRGIEAMTQMQVVIDATDTAAMLRMTVLVDGTGAEVVTIPSEPLVIAADRGVIRRTAQFALTAKKTGMAVVSIIVTDGARIDTVVLRVVVAEPPPPPPPPPLQILSPHNGTQIALVRGDGSTAATQVEVIFMQTNVEVPVALSVQLEQNTLSTVSSVIISSTSSMPTLIASDDNNVRTRFTLIAVEMGNTTLTLVASDSLGNRASVSVRVSVERLNELCESCLVPDMVTVPAGTFAMGSPDDSDEAYDNERPQHRVTISRSFAVGKYEVTRGQFAAFIAATGYDAGSNWRNPDWPNPVFEQSDTHPVVYVSWDDTQAYTRWLSVQTGEQYRLLSEVEWEYAARDGTTTRYHFGDTISLSQANYAWYNGGTVVVDSYSANDFGLHDMHGNVREWVEDCWHYDYKGAPTDGRAWVGDCDSDSRVLRGGSWSSDPRFLRSAQRDGSLAGYRNIADGFRVARTLEPYEDIPVRIVSPAEGITYDLISNETYDVTVIIEAPNTAAEITLAVSVDDAEVVSVPSTPIKIAVASDAIQRNIQFKFKLTAKEAGEALVTPVATDNFGNRDETKLHVLVQCSASPTTQTNGSFRDCTNCPVMVTVPCGTFVMGLPDGGRDGDEGPQHRVTISRSFAVGKYEVTRGQFAAFVASTEYDADGWRNPRFEQTDTHPVYVVSWNDAQAYISWLSEQTEHQYRLLSEAEWEYAARARTTTRYHFGDTISQRQANYRYDDYKIRLSGNGTVEVGSYPANAFGLHDMHGNVEEWVEDCWHNDYEGAPTDGGAWVSDCVKQIDRVLRGGYFNDYAPNLRSANRDWDFARNGGFDVGFRVARALEP